MKTCKKTLSLVLVFALVLSVFTYSASADFTDQDEITYEEAAVVLEALGVIDGYEDGSYQPDVVLSREEAAAIIARMKLGQRRQPHRGQRALLRRLRRPLERGLHSLLRQRGRG